MSEAVKTDGRREAGERTRQRLLDATRALLAEHGEDGVTLRAITDAANANVAAVSYHFGSKEALCRAACEEAIGRLVEEQIDGLRRLGEDATLEEIAAAWARPVIGAMCGPPCASKSFHRILARVIADPPPELKEWTAATLARGESELMRPLRRALPGVPDDELRFRVECAASVFHFMSMGSMRAEVGTKTETELERLLIPVIAGALAGGTRPAPIPA
jgi:AcrR family transcriptional regulator